MKRTLFSRLSPSSRSLTVVVMIVLLATTVSTTTPLGTIAASPNQPNDTTQARLRVSQCVYGEPEMDIYLNGEVPLDAGIPLTAQQGDVSRYEYLTPGTYSLAVVPVGQETSKELLGPLDVTMAAGHRYTVVVLGQKDEANHNALVIDETAAYQAIGAKPTDSAHITVNNIRGVSGIDLEPGLVSGGSAPYGGFKAATYPAGPFKGFAVSFAVSGSPDTFIDRNDEEGYNAPAMDTLDCFGGTYPGTIGEDFDTHTSASTSLLNAGDYLQVLTDEAAKSGGIAPTNNTFLTVLKAAGMTDMLASGGPYLVFAPTDEAFAALPKDKLNALMADQQALTNLVRRHIVQGYYPPATLIAGHYEHRFDRTVTNMLGEKLALLTNDEGAFINAENVGSFDGAMVANGTRVFPYIDKVLLSATDTTIAPGMPTTGASTSPLDRSLPFVVVLALLLVMAGSILLRRYDMRR